MSIVDRLHDAIRTHYDKGGEPLWKILCGSLAYEEIRLSMDRRPLEKFVREVAWSKSSGLADDAFVLIEEEPKPAYDGRCPTCGQRRPSR